MKKLSCFVFSFIFLFLTIHTAIAAPASFVAGRINSTNAPSAPVLADFNGDGRQDLVFIDYLRDFVTICLGNGDGSFQAENVIYAGTGTEGKISSGATAVAGDFNGDGKMDLAVANNTQYIISVLIGNGDGTFRTKVDYGAGINLTDITTGDFNGDGKLDLAAGSDSGTLTAILLGNGNGTFQAVTYYGTGTSTPYTINTISVGDLNSDGKLDLVIRNYNMLRVLYGNGDGTFSQTDYSIGGGVILVADFNGDGKLDLATTGINTIRILLGNGDSTFQPYVEYTTGVRPVSLKSGDFNGDGYLDLIAANYDDKSISILLGNGDGSFQAKKDYYLGTILNSVTVTELNGDGRLDLVTENGDITDGATFSVISLLGNGDGTFQTQVDYAAGGNLQSVRTADFNGDGKMDLAVANSGSPIGSVAILLGIGDGTFQPKVDYPTGIYSNFVAAGDFNGDGKPDLAVVNQGDSPNGGIISILLGNGNGTFQAKTDYAVGGYPESVTVGDFNGDGKLDLAAANGTSAVDGGQTISILLGNGNGTFQTKVDYFTGIWPSKVVAGDFNGDGKLDLAVTDNGGGSGPAVSILLGNGNGTFQARNSLPITTGCTGRATLDILAADLNGDSKLDLAVTGCNAVGVLLGNGNGTFQAEVNYVTDVWGAGSVTVGDFNGDGKLDLATSTYRSRTVSVLLGNGNGTFQTSMDFLTGGSHISATVPFTAGPTSITAGDFNGDGRLDLVTPNYGMVSIMLNNTQPDWVSGYPTAGTIGAATLQLLLKSNENGTAYFVALPSGSPAPTAGQVKGGINAAGAAIAANLKGSVSLTANAEASVVLSLISPVPGGTVYDVYAVAENNFPKLQLTPAKTSIATPIQAPTVSTDAATLTANGTYRLDGRVTANGASTSVSFEYGTTTSYGQTATVWSALASSANNALVSKLVFGLTCNTSYHFRVVGQNSAGKTYGSDATFLTAPCLAPTANNLISSTINSTSATLGGTVNANDFSTIVTFEYGTTTSYGTTASGGSVAAGTGATAVSASITGLTCGTIYHFRISATNSVGTTNSSDASFPTFACTPTASGTVPLDFSLKTGTTFTVSRVAPDGTTSPIYSGSQTNYTDTAQLLPNTTYSYYVTSDTDPTQTTLVTIHTPLYNGWNIIGVPYDTTGIIAATLFGSPTSAVYEWIPTSSTNPDDSGYYAIVGTLTPGKGYFVKAGSNSTMLAYSGAANPAAVTVTLKPGYTLISNTAPTNMSNIDSTWLLDGVPLNDAIVPSATFPIPVIGGALYWWNGTTYDSWNILDVIPANRPTIEPWKAYWILNLDTVNHTLTIQ